MPKVYTTGFLFGEAAMALSEIVPFVTAGGWVPAAVIAVASTAFAVGAFFAEE